MPILLNKKNIHEKEGIYVWNKIKDKSTNHRIGRATNVYARITVQIQIKYFQN